MRKDTSKETTLKELGEMIRSGKLGEKEASWLKMWKYLVNQMAGPLVIVGANEKSPEGTQTIPDFKNPGEFGVYWTKHGFSLLDILATLEVKTLADIKDLRAASETLAKIVAAREKEKSK